MAREVIQWMQNVEQAFAGLNSNTGTLRKQMMQQFARGSVFGGFNASGTQLATPTRLQAVANAQAAVTADDGTEVARAQGLANHLAAMQALTDIARCPRPSSSGDSHCRCRYPRDGYGFAPHKNPTTCQAMLET